MDVDHYIIIFNTDAYHSSIRMGKLIYLHKYHEPIWMDHFTVVVILALISSSIMILIFR